MKKALARENSNEDLINKDEHEIQKIERHRRDFNGKGVLKIKKKDVELNNS